MSIERGVQMWFKETRNKMYLYVHRKIEIVKNLLNASTKLNWIPCSNLAKDTPFDMFLSMHHL